MSRAWKAACVRPSVCLSMSSISPFEGMASPQHRLRFPDDGVQVAGILEALRVDLEDVLGTGRPRREPAVGRHDLDAAERGIVARRLREDRGDRLAREGG